MRLNRLSMLLSLGILLSSGCGSMSTRLHRDLEKEEYAGVLESGLRHLEKHPEDWQVRRYTGDAAWALGDSIRAYNIWRPAAETYMIEQPRLGRKITQLAVRRGDFAFADTLLSYNQAFSGSSLLEELQQTMSIIVKQMHIQATWAMQRGDNAIVNDQWPLAETMYKRALESYASGDIEARASVLRAWRIIQDGLSGYEQDAEKVLQNATSVSPKLAVVRYLTACVYLDLGKLDRAHENFAAAADLVEQEPWSSLARKTQAGINPNEK